MKYLKGSILSGNFTGILIETDVLIQHLTVEQNTGSDLEFLMTRYTCFTTVINSSEVYFACKNLEEKEIADKLLRSLKVLGINSRYSLDVFSVRGRVENIRNALIFVLAEKNRLPVVTYKVDKFDNINTGVFTPDELRG